MKNKDYSCVEVNDTSKHAVTSRNELFVNKYISRLPCNETTVIKLSILFCQYENWPLRAVKVMPICIKSCYDFNYINFVTFYGVNMGNKKSVIICDHS